MNMENQKFFRQGEILTEKEVEILAKRKIGKILIIFVPLICIFFFSVAVLPEILNDRQWVGVAILCFTLVAVLIFSLFLILTMLEIIKLKEEQSYRYCLKHIKKGVKTEVIPTKVDAYEDFITELKKFAKFYAIRRNDVNIEIYTEIPSSGIVSKFENIPVRSFVYYYELK